MTYPGLARVAARWIVRNGAVAEVPALVSLPAIETYRFVALAPTETVNKVAKPATNIAVDVLEMCAKFFKGNALIMKRSNFDASQLPKFNVSTKKFSQ